MKMYSDEALSKADLVKMSVIQDLHNHEHKARHARLVKLMIGIGLANALLTLVLHFL
jgi:hypothetical protein